MNAGHSEYGGLQEGKIHIVAPGHEYTDCIKAIFIPVRILNDVKQERISFSSDSSQLSGVLSKPNCDANGLVLLLHPHPLFSGNLDNSVIRGLDRIFLKLEYATLRFNFRGPRGKYEGVQGATQDALRAIDFLDSLELPVVGLAGYSFGGSVALRLFLVKSFEFVIVLSASIDILLEDKFDISLLSKLRSSVLLFHGLDDTTVPYADVKKISNEILGAKTVALQNEDHFYDRSMSVVQDEISSFLARLS
jgi:alpha/beta superfamily hydrolase